MAAGRPVSEETRARVRELHGQGLARNQIARRLGLTPSVVTRITQAAGLTFEREADTADARAARLSDLRTLAFDTAVGMLSVAKQELERARKPYIVYSFGGQFNDYSDHTLDLPPAEAVRSMQTTAAIAFDKAMKALDQEPDGLDEAVSVLDRLEAQMDAEFDDADDAEFGVVP